MTTLDGAKLKQILAAECIEFKPSMSHKIYNTCQAIWRAAQAEQREIDAEICQRDLCNRSDDHAANYFDGGLRHCAAAILAQED